MNISNFRVAAICASLMLLSACGSSDSTPANTPPQAHAGNDLAVEDYRDITLDGSGSVDADGDALSYQWQQTSGEPMVALDKPQSPQPSFFLPVVEAETELVFELTVSDGQASGVDTVSVVVTPVNHPPVAVSNGDQLVIPGTSVAIDGEQSWDPNGDVLNYKWLSDGSDAYHFLDQDGRFTLWPEFVSGHVFVPAARAGEEMPLWLEVDDSQLRAVEEITLAAEECPGHRGHVFIECVGQSWLGLSGWQVSNDDPSDFFDYYHGGADNHVQWSVETLDDAVRNRVIDVRFTSEEATGFFFFRVAGHPNVSSIDWMQFAGGELVFDMRVMETNGAALKVKVECVWPCESREFTLDAGAPEQWQTHTIAVDELVGSGLNLARLSTGFQIFPEWDNQQGVRVQLDNIRWELGHQVKHPDVVFENQLGPLWGGPTEQSLEDNGGGLGAWDSESDTDYRQGDSEHHVRWHKLFTGDPERLYALEIGFYDDHATGGFYISASDVHSAGVDMSDYLDGELSFAIKALDYASEATELFVKARCGQPCETLDMSVGRPPVGEWHTVSVPVSDMVAAGLDLSRVSEGFVILPSRDDQAGTRFWLDNIRWHK